jgi:hypothetical protein
VSPGRSQPVRFRGRELRPSDIGEIRTILRSHTAATRTELARLVCPRLKWRRANGELRVRAGLDLLVRLEERGLVKLPASRRQKASPRRQLTSAGNSDDGSRGDGPPLSIVTFRRVVVRPITSNERDRWEETLHRFHYLGHKGDVGERLCYLAEIDGQWLALLSWAAAALENRARDRYIGWDEKTKYERLSLVANNTRFLILPWVCVPHLASHVLSKNLRRLSRDWEARYAHPIFLAETFVDLQRFTGTCYQSRPSRIPSSPGACSVSCSGVLIRCKAMNAKVRRIDCRPKNPLFNSP